MKIKNAQKQHRPSIHVKDRTVFSALGYRIDIPFNKPPQYLNLDMGKGIYFIHEYGIIIRKPRDYPWNMYQHFKLSKKAEDVSHLKQFSKTNLVIILNM